MKAKRKYVGLVEKGNNKLKEVETKTWINNVIINNAGHYELCCLPYSGLVGNVAVHGLQAMI